jgi:superfamily II DNA/RNA helicase
VHADPPAEHKAYLHRSGRTARAGSSGTVITLATQEQARDVRGLTRAAGIVPTTTRIQGGSHPLLAELAPGERRLSAPSQTATAPASTPSPAKSGGGGNRKRRGKRRGGSPAGSTPQRREQTQQAPGRSRSSNRATAGKDRTSSGRHSAASFSAGRR